MTYLLMDIEAGKPYFGETVTECLSRIIEVMDIIKNDDTNCFDVVLQIKGYILEDEHTASYRCEERTKQEVLLDARKVLRNEIIGGRYYPRYKFYKEL